MKRYIILVAFLLLAGCKSFYSTACPPVINYTKEEQQELALFLENNNNTTIDIFLIDYLTTRENLKICQ